MEERTYGNKSHPLLASSSFASSPLLLFASLFLLFTFQLCYSRFQPVYFAGKAGLTLLARIVVRSAGHGLNGDALTSLPHHPRRHANHGCIGRNLLEHHRTSADERVVADGDRAEDAGADTHQNVMAQRGVPFACFLAGASQGHPLVEGNIISDLRSLADDGTHPVVNEESPADSCAWMNLNAGEVAVDLGNEPGGHAKPTGPKPVRQTMGDDRVEAGIKQQHLERAAGRRIALQRRLNICANRVEYRH